MDTIFKALGDENRLRILNVLMHYEPCVCELEVVLDLSQSNASRHLSKLKNAGLIRSYKEGQWTHYRLNELFRDNHTQLLEYLNGRFRNEGPYEADLSRFRVYLDSPYNCHNISSDKDAVTAYFSNRMAGEKMQNF